MGLVGVGFDLDHTLVIDNKLERVAFLRLLELLLARGGRALGSIFEETDRIDALLAEQRSGAFPIDEAVARFVAERGVAPSEEYARRFRTMAQEMVEQFVVPLPGVAATLEALRRRGVRVAVMTNGWNPLQVLKAQRGGFDGPVLASADIGEQKPSRRCFEAMVDVLGSPPQDTWYVGDDPRCDVEGAREAGLNGVWLDDERRSYPPELGSPAHRIGSLEALLSILPSTLAVSP